MARVLFHDVKNSSGRGTMVSVDRAFQVSWDVYHHY